MCTAKPPKPPRPAVPPPPVKAPEIQLGSDKDASDTRRLKRRGRNLLRTDLQIQSSRGTGLTIPQ